MSITERSGVRAPAVHRHTDTFLVNDTRHTDTFLVNDDTRHTDTFLTLTQRERDYEIGVTPAFYLQLGATLLKHN